LHLSDLFENSPGKKVLLSGNEALARGIYEAGVYYTANYPGTPLSEVGDSLKYLSDKSNNFIFNYSINEKVALESCIGASWAGTRSVVMFKHVGLNVTADPLHTFPYSGIVGGMLILYGDDPGIHSSTNAQDNRLYSHHTKIPILEPATVQECKDFIIEGLKISESFRVPIIIHLTTRLSHSHGILLLGKVAEIQKQGFFERDPDRYINTLNRALTNQKKYFKKIIEIETDKKLSHLFNNIRQIKNKKNNKIGIITSGICYSYVIEACYKLRIDPPILKLGLIYPINKDCIYDFVNQFELKSLLIFEELEPFIETVVRQILCYEYNKKDIKIHGKEFLPNIGELNTEIIIKFISKYFNIQNTKILTDINQKEEIIDKIIFNLPIREPTFCPGCPYRPVFYILKKTIERIKNESGIEFIFSGDISCATLSEAYPFQLLDWVVCMGASIGIANGMVKVIDPTKQKIIAFMGDSTFYHCGIPPIIEAIKNNLDYTIILFNNYWTAMTGHQEHVGTPKSIIKDPNKDTFEISLEKIIKSLNLKNFITTTAYNLEKLEKIFYENLQKKGIKVIVINEECALEKSRRTKREKTKSELHKNQYVYYTISSSCNKCNECIEFFGCPAINIKYDKEINHEGVMKNKNDLVYYIDESMCLSDVCPGICKYVCKNGMILKTIIKHNRDNI